MFPNVTASDLGILITALAAFFGGLGTFLDNRRKAKADDDAKAAAAKQLGVEGNQSWYKILTDALVAEGQRNLQLREQVTTLEGTVSTLRREKIQQDDTIAELQREQRDSKRRIQALEEENQTLRKDNATLKKENADLKKDNAAIRKENHRIEEDNKRIKEQNRRLIHHLEEIGQPVPEDIDRGDNPTAPKDTKE